MPGERILIVEDERAVARGLEYGLESEGFAVLLAENGKKALDLTRTQKPQLILLDIRLPDISGFDVCRQLRGEGARMPILMLTARDEASEKVVGLELGADDYITKPYSRREVLARIKAVLRRYRDKPDSGIYHFRDITVDTNRCEVLRGGIKIDLTATEFKLLKVFLENRGKVMTIDDLLCKTWGSDVVLTDRVIYTHVNHLRKKIEPDPHKPQFLVGVRGIGYRFDA